MFELIDSPSSFELIFMEGTIIDVELTISSYAQLYSDPWNQRYPMRLLLERFIIDSESTDGVYIDSNRSYLNVS